MNENSSRGRGVALCAGVKGASFQALREHLVRDGFAVDHCDDLDLASARLRAVSDSVLDRPRIVFLGTGPLELLPETERLVAAARKCEVPLIVLTSAADEAHEALSLPLDPALRLALPLDAEALSRCIERALRTSANALAPAAVPHVDGRGVAERSALSMDSLGAIQRSTFHGATLEGLREFAGSDSDADGLVTELVALYLQSAHEVANELRAAAGERDPVRVAAAAHKLRGSSLNVGAKRLARLAGTLETEARQDPEADFAAQCSHIASEVDRFERRITSYMQRN